MLTLFMAISGGIDWDDVLLLKSTSMRIKVFFLEHVSSTLAFPLQSTFAATYA